MKKTVSNRNNVGSVTRLSSKRFQHFSVTKLYVLTGTERIAKRRNQDEVGHHVQKRLLAKGPSATEQLRMPKRI